jgi:hypothetical protein
MTLTSEKRAVEVLAWLAARLNIDAVGFQAGWGSNPEDQARLDGIGKTLAWLRDPATAAALSAAGCLRDDRERCTCPYLDPSTWISADCPVHLRDDREGETVAAVTLSTPERLKISAVVHKNYYMPDVFAVVEEIIAERNATTTDWSPVTP